MIYIVQARFFIKCIAADVQDGVYQELKDVKFFSVLNDGSTDIRSIEEEMIIVR